VSRCLAGANGRGSGDPLRIPRRRFLKIAMVATGGAVFTREVPAAVKDGRAELVDVNVSLGRWPRGRLPGDEPAVLVAKLRSRGVRQAWVGSFDGLLHNDLRAVNAGLADDCRRHGQGLLLPFGSLNHNRPGWEQDLECCVEVHHMRGVRLHPNYHGYKLDLPALERLLKVAAERGLVVQIALTMEDERMMNPLMRVEPVDPGPLRELTARTPRLRLVLLNALGVLHGEALRKLDSAGDIYVEISMLEGVGGVGNLLEQVPARQILFGSYAPRFYFEAAELKLKESVLTREQRQAIGHENAKRLIARRR
jgi:hypothetical protein